MKGESRENCLIKSPVEYARQIVTEFCMCCHLTAVAAATAPWIDTAVARIATIHCRRLGAIEAAAADVVWLNSFKRISKCFKTNKNAGFQDSGSRRQFDWPVSWKTSAPYYSLVSEQEKRLRIRDRITTLWWPCRKIVSVTLHYCMTVWVTLSNVSMWVMPRGITQGRISWSWGCL